MRRFLALSLLAAASFASALAQESWSGGFFDPRVGPEVFGDASNVYFAGSDQMGSLDVNGLVRWDGQRLYPEGPEGGHRVYAGAVASNGDLVVASFSSTEGNILMQRSGGAWTTLVNGLNRVHKIVLDGQNRPCYVANQSSTGSVTRVSCTFGASISGGRDVAVSPSGQIALAVSGASSSGYGVVTVANDAAVSTGLPNRAVGFAVAYAPNGTLYTCGSSQSVERSC